MITNQKNHSCCFTGHRPQKLPWGFNESQPQCKNLKKRLAVEIENAIKSGYHTFWCGMALGFDLMCAETILQLKKTYPHIKLFGALPCKNQEKLWQAAQQKRYRKILLQLDGVRCVFDEYNGAECMHERNEFMINSSSLVIALFNGKAGGTKKTLEYAEKQGCKIVVLAP